MVEAQDATRVAARVTMAGRLSRFLHLEPRPVSDEAFKEERARDVASGLEVEPAQGGQPFLRCPVCEADNSKFAEKCINCARPMQTADVLAWNQHLWKKRTEVQIAPAEDQRKLGEAIAEEIAQRERAKLLWSEDPTAPFGLRLLRWIPDPTVRFAIGAALATLFGGGIVTAFNGSRLGGLLALAVVALFLPQTQRRWWR